MRRSLLSLCVLLACSVLIGDRNSHAQQAQLLNREYEIKTGYFAYFGQYVNWPNPPFAGANREFVIGVLGSNNFGAHLRGGGNGFAIDTPKIKTKSIQRKRIRVVEYRSVGDFNKNYSPCHILFISRSSAAGAGGETVQARVSAAVQKTKGQPVLLVSEATGMDASKRLAQSGVTISYWNNNQTRQVNMIINRQAAKLAQLSIRASLLRLRMVTVL